MNTLDTNAGKTEASWMHRLSVPFALFSGAFLLLLVLSWFFLLPLLTRVNIAGEKRDFDELSSLSQSLKASIATLEEERDERVLHERSPAYEKLLSEKKAEKNLWEVREWIVEAGRTLGTAQNPVVYIQSLSLEGNSLTLIGVIRSVGPRSMTVLGQFTEELKRIPAFKEISTPRFERKETENGDFYSPFNFKISL